MQRRSSPRVLHLSTYDISGGAALASYRIHKSLQAIGIDSRMLARFKASADESVVEVPLRQSFFAKWRRNAKEARIAKDFSPFQGTYSAKLEMFSDDRAAASADVRRCLPAADIHHLHWVAGLIDFTDFFGSPRSGAPLVWTLHDINPFTGGCHYAVGCEKYRQACGACPHLGSVDPGDLAAQVFNRKAKALARLRPETTTIVAPSNWMADEARRSRLFRDLNVVRIANGIDTDQLQPRDRAEARKRFGLPQDARIVLFVSHYLNNFRKGLDLLTAAVEALPDADNVVIALVGGFGAAPATHRPLIRLGEISSATEMSYAYSAADLFICPSRSDNLPNVAIEAISCGVPTVGFDVGGIGDVVRRNETGFLAPPEDVSALSRGIATLLRDAGERARLSKICRAFAVENFNAATQAKAYLSLYESLHETSIGQPRNWRADAWKKPADFAVS